MSSKKFVLSLLLWIAVWTFWFVVTGDFHPTKTLALIATTSLITVYAIVSYVNHLVLIPRFLKTNQRGKYVATLAISMLVLTAIALAVIRVSYLEIVGPDPDPYGLYKHYLIDLFGMGVHLLAAAGVVAIAKRMS